MEPIINTEEAKRHYQEVLQEVEHERSFGQNPSKVVVRALSALGGVRVRPRFPSAAQLAGQV